MNACGKNENPIVVGSQNSSLKKRRVQLSLASFLILIAVICAGLTWFNWTQQFRRAANSMDKLSVSVSYKKGSNNFEKPQYLDVPDWKRRFFGDDYFYEMSRLDIWSSSLDSSNDFWSELEKHLGAMRNVEVIRLNGVVVDSRAIEVLNRFPLQELYFYDCFFEPGVFEQLEQLRDLEVLLLSKIKQEVPFRQLSQLKRLKEIGFEKCLVDLEAVEYLRSNLHETYVFAY